MSSSYEVEIPTGSKVIIEPNDISNDDVLEDETIVNIRVTQPKESSRPSKEPERAIFSRTNRYFSKWRCCPTMRRDTK